MLQNSNAENELLKKQNDRLRLDHLDHIAKIVIALQDRFGDEVIEIVKEVHAQNCRRVFSEFASKEENNDIEALIRVVWGSGADYKKIDGGYLVKCEKCCQFDRAKKLGITDLAYQLICCDDPHITEGFNPKIGFKRTKTLMQGHDCCDNFYYWKE